MRISGRKHGRHRAGSTDHRIDQPKLSATIIAVARPWIERLGECPPLLAVEFAYRTCGGIWNVSRLKDETAREKEIRQFRKGVLSAAPKGTEEEVGRMFDLLYERALSASPADHRLVMDMSVKDLGEGLFRLDVVSAASAGAP